MRTLHAISFGFIPFVASLFLSCSGSKDKTVAGGFSDETETTEISGILVGADGKPEANARLVLRQDFRSANSRVAIDSLRSYEAFADIDGKFSFDSIPSGTWNLDVRNNAKGSMQRVVAKSAHQDLGTDTLKQIVASIYRNSNPDLKFVFLPQTNEVVPLKDGSALLAIPGDSVEVLPYTEQEGLIPDPTAVPEKIPAAISSAWIPSFTLNFEKADPWADATGNITHVGNVNAAPTVTDAATVFAGNECFHIVPDRDYSYPEFRIRARVSFAQVTGTQAILCASDDANSDAWCLRKKGADSLIFWFQDDRQAADSVVLSGIPSKQWLEIAATVTPKDVSLGVTGMETIKRVKPIDLSSFAQPIAIGCQEWSGPNQFLNASVDWISMDIP